MKLLAFWILSIALALGGCRVNNVNTEQITNEEEPMITAGPPVIVYRTKANYDSLVPVILSPGDDSVYSFPHPRDLQLGNELAYPIQLIDGYLLDRRGINEHVAFLDYTYDDYSQLPKAPKAEDILEHVLYPDPLMEMYHAGSRYAYHDLVPELIAIIESGDYSKWKKLY